jgi:hypothetical protein
MIARIQLLQGITAVIEASLSVERQQTVADK